MKKTFLLIYYCLFSLTVFSQNVRVKILATGGTIAGVGTSADRAGYKAGVLPIETLLNAVPEIHKIAQVSGEQVASISSQDMTEDVWLKLSKRVNEIFKNNEADAIVITHGTDTQEETAYFLNLSTRYNKPVVFTGAMRASTAISADGPKNLLDAVTVAASPESKGQGVMVVFSEKIFDGRSVVKINTTNVDAFAAPDAGPIGQVFDKKVVYYMKSMRASNPNSFFDIENLTILPRVDIVYMYAGAHATLIDAAIQSGAKGIVIAGVGNGNYNKEFADAIDRAIQKEVVVCRSSRIPTGRVTLYDEIDDDKVGTIVADDLNPQKARVLLMLALTQTTDKKKLQNYFFTY